MVKMRDVVIKYRRHAQERKTQKGITDSEVKRAIQRGAKRRQENGKILTSYADLKIVYKKQEGIHYIITIID